MKRKEREYGPSERRLPEYSQPKRRKTFAQPTQNNTRQKFLAPYSVRIEKFPSSEECKSIIEKLENEGVLKANFDEIGYLCNNLKKVKKSNNDDENYKKIMARIAAILFYRLNPKQITQEYYLLNPNRSMEEGEIIQDSESVSSKNLSLVLNAFSVLSTTSFDIEYEAFGQERRWIINSIVSVARMVYADSGTFKPQELSSIANCFAKLTQQQLSNSHIQEAIAVISKRVSTDSERFVPQSLSNIANCFAKLTQQQLSNFDIQEAIVEIAKRVSTDSEKFVPQALSNIANCFAKLTEDQLSNPHIQGAIAAIARRVSADSEKFVPQALSNIANCFAKLTEEQLSNPHIQGAIAVISKRVSTDSERFVPQSLSNIANCFAKLTEEQLSNPHIQGAIAAIAKRVSIDSKRFKPQELSNIANCFAKLTQQQLSNYDIQGSIAAIARRVSADSVTKNLDTQALSSIANCFAKLTQQQLSNYDIQGAIAAIAKRVSIDSKRFEPQHLSNIANCFAKLTEDQPLDSDIQGAIAAIARMVSADSKTFKPQELSNIANCFAKLTQQQLSNFDIQGAIAAIARRVSADSVTKNLDTQALSNIANCFAKLTEEQLSNSHIQEAIAAIARMVSADSKTFKPQELSNIANCFAKLTQQQLSNSHIQEAIVEIAKRVSTDSKRFEPQHLSNIANCFAKIDYDQESSILHAAQTIITYFVNLEEQSCEINDISNVIYMIGRMPSNRGCRDDVLKLVKKLEVITKRVLEEKKNENNSQDFSGIFISIYFLKRLLNIRSLRNSIFKLYRDVVPQLVEVLEQKQKDLIVAKSESSISQEEKTKNDTNSALLVRHAYFLAAALEKAIATITKKNSPRRKNFNDVLNKVKNVYQTLQQDDLSNSKINPTVIGLLSLEGDVSSIGTSAIDAYLQTVSIENLNPTKIADGGSVWEALAAKVRSDDGFERLDAESVESYQPKTINMLAKEVQPEEQDSIKSTNPQNSFSLLHYLTGIPYVRVKSTFAVNGSILNKVVSYEGQQYRIDCFGGSAMKGNFELEALPTFTAIKIDDTKADSDFSKFYRDLFSNQESFYYFQRALTPSIKPEDVLVTKGTKITVFKDKEGEHLFRIKNPLYIQGGDVPEFLSLKPHDGFGFIKQSEAEKLGLNFSPIKEGEKKDTGALSYQALLHLKPQDDLIDELSKNGRKAVSSVISENNERSAKKIYYGLTAGGVPVTNLIACPVDDDKVVIPDIFKDVGENIILGRNPYNKTNLFPAQNNTDNDNSRFLSSMASVQYTMIGELTDEEKNKQRSFFKGMMGVVPDELWPEEYNDSAVVVSAEDQKLSSNWKEEKTKVGSGGEDCQTFTLKGVLAATERFKPGYLIGVPTEKQKAIGGDFDGDLVNIIDGNQFPALYQAVGNLENGEVVVGLRDIQTKPSKSFTPLKSDQDFGRAELIVKMYCNYMQDFNTLNSIFFQLHNENKIKASRKILDIVTNQLPKITETENAEMQDEPEIEEQEDEFDTTELQEFLNQSKIQIPAQDCSNEEVVKFVASTLALCINISTDLYKSGDKNVEMLEQLKGLFREEIQSEVPFISKSVLRDLQYNNLDLEKSFSQNSIPGLVYKQVSNSLREQLTNFQTENKAKEGKIKQPEQTQTQTLPSTEVGKRKRRANKDPEQHSKKLKPNQLTEAANQM